MFWTVVLEKTLPSLLDSKKIKPINPKGNQPWMSIGRTDAEAEAPILATWCEELTHWKRPWCWERLKAGGEGATEDEMVGWHHWLNDLTLSKLRETVKDREVWSVAVHGVAESDTSEQLNWTDGFKNFQTLQLWRTYCPVNNSECWWDYRGWGL